MPAQQQRRGRVLLDCQFPRTLDEPLLRFSVVPLLARNPISITAQRIRLCDTIQQIEFALPREPPKGAVANFVSFLVELAWLQMFAHERNHLRTDVVTIERVNIQGVEETFGRLHACFFVSTRAPTAVDEFRCCWLAKIVTE